jgi:hypothetical protein
MCKNSCIGKKIGCIVGCGVIKDSSVKYVGTPHKNASGNYLVVENNEFVQVKHVLVFAENSKSPRNYFAVMIILFLLVPVLRNYWRKYLQNIFGV